MAAIKRTVFTGEDVEARSDLDRFFWIRHPLIVDKGIPTTQERLRT